ncbi:hypothetical protein PT974_02456 [Cladobotryum mycophilum]|uniref:Uncharacterized protein n=1 Tax=Cladobotryum mycophilum TaxID=491253 RepID=A0ABR0SYA5_9HYPO
MPPKAAAPNSGKPASLWERADFLMELSIALYQVADFNGVLNTQIRNAVAEYLVAQGHEVGWDAIR